MSIYTSSRLFVQPSLLETENFITNFKNPQWCSLFLKRIVSIKICLCNRKRFYTPITTLTIFLVYHFYVLTFVHQTYNNVEITLSME